MAVIMMSWHAPKPILKCLEGYIISAGIPKDWVKTYSMYDVCMDQMLIRIDCMEVTYAGYFHCWCDHIKETEKLISEIDRFIMLLWGEPGQQEIEY